MKDTWGRLLSAVALAAAMLVLVAVLARPPATVLGQPSSQIPDDFPGLRVRGRHLHDRYGDQVILVGVNKMVIWTDRDGIPAFPEIARTGANAVRVVWLTEGSAEELDIALTNAILHKLIPIVDCHDSTGEWSLLSTCVDYWVRPDIVAVLRKHEAHLLLNIANEAGEGVVSPPLFRAAYELAIRRIRATGLHVPLVIDAQRYGQDIDDLQLNGPYLIDADPDHNLMFSIHMWWPTAWRGTAVDQLVINEIAESVAMDLPLIIGEFAHKGPGCACCIPYRTIIEQAHLNEIGYLPWSWGPGNRDCVEMDMTEDGTFDTLHGWGLEVAITSPHSIQNVAVRPEWIVQATPIPTPTPAPTVSPISGPDGLLSLGRPVTASSTESDVLTPDRAVDGRLDTRWSSAYSDPQTYTVDLGATHPIARVILEWETAFARQYKVQVSDDGEVWADVVHETDGDGGQDDHIVAAHGRYVRLLGLERATEWGYSLWELWIFERDDMALPEPIQSDDMASSEQPDLVISSIRWLPQAPQAGDAITFQATVRNIGTSATRMDPPVRCLFQIDGETVAWGELRKPLSPGWDAIVIADHGPAESGTWVSPDPREFIVLAWIDPTEPGDEGAVAEALEHNNMQTAYGKVCPVAVQSAPVPTALTADQEATAAPQGSVDATPAHVVALPIVETVPDTPERAARVPVGPIVGGVVAVTLLVLLVIFRRRRA